MNISMFDVLGPVMVGPSSSHTAGAVRMGNIAHMLSESPVQSVSFGLHGSFWQAGKGHGTRHALLAGVMGLKQDDERIASAFRLAEERGLTHEFYHARLIGMHENSAVIAAKYGDGSERNIVASSVGGGRIRIVSIDGFAIGVSGEMPAVIINYMDVRGVISEATGLIAKSGVNIAAMRVSRSAKGMRACCIIETDTEVNAGIFAGMAQSGRITDVSVLKAICGGNGDV